MISLQGWREAVPPPESCGRASGPQGAQPRPDVCVVCIVGLKIAGDPFQSIRKLLPRGQSHEWYFQETLVVFIFCWIYLAFHVVGGPASHLDWTLPEFLEKNTLQPTLLRLAPWSIIQKEKAVSFHCLLWWIPGLSTASSPSSTIPIGHPWACPSNHAVGSLEGAGPCHFSFFLLTALSPILLPYTPRKLKEWNESRRHTQGRCDELTFWSGIPGFQSQGLELPVPGLPLPEQLILTPWASVSSQTWRLKQANALKAFSKVLASSQGWTLRKREVTVTSMGLAVKMDVDKLCYRVISQAFRKGKSMGNSYSLGLYIKPVLAKQNFRYL